MTKREKTAFLNKLTRMEEKLAKKRDEVRALVSDMSELVDCAERGCEDIDYALDSLRNAKDAIEDAADALSEHV